MPNVIHGINTNTNTPCECKDFNPMQQMHCEELLNCFLYFLSMRTAAGDPQEVLCPKLACIFQSFSNVNPLESGKI